MKVAINTAKTAKNNAEKDMNLFASDELVRHRKLLRKQRETKEGGKQQWILNKQEFSEEWEELKRGFEERKNNRMAEVANKFNAARNIIVDDQTMEADEKADNGNLFRMCGHCNHFLCII